MPTLPRTLTTALLALLLATPALAADRKAAPKADPTPSLSQQERQCAAYGQFIYVLARIRDAGGSYTETLVNMRSQPMYRNASPDIRTLMERDLRDVYAAVDYSPDTIRNAWELDCLARARQSHARGGAPLDEHPTIMARPSSPASLLMLGAHVTDRVCEGIPRPSMALVPRASRTEPSRLATSRLTPPCSTRPAVVHRSNSYEITAFATGVLIPSKNLLAVHQLDID